MASSISISQAPCFIAKNGSHKSNKWLHQSSLSSNSIILSSKHHHPPRPLSSSPVSVVETGDDDVGLNFSGCKGCGKEVKENGCNGDGRIQGGIATVPGFGWWPIKAYRPCPGFVEAGGRYRRVGQSMDEVAFGRGDSESTT
ncbi:unnamed protein product [Brassica oleracea var. botrytis]|uniref:Uncharacterized protein n=2 Tax=Brassica TaxID=3705 RepID=A0A8X7RH11_BRACI|nr:hypothetical protein Bca52824_046362 [Brassica carinata]CAF1859838.1 unnamed protein product [Brassica napus]